MMLFGTSTPARVRSLTEPTKVSERLDDALPCTANISSGMHHVDVTKNNVVSLPTNEEFALSPFVFFTLVPLDKKVQPV